MDFKITSTKTETKSRGFTLIEMLFTVGVTTLCMAALATFFLFSTHSFTTLFNYVDLDDANRIAMDQLTRDVRQANSVFSYTSNQLVLVDSDGLNLSYTYDSTAGTLTRSKSGVNKIVLTGCDRLAFVIGQRNPVNGTYDVYPAADATTAKVVNVSWMCSRQVFGRKEDTESVQTARIVIRKQGT
jgi:prepilin-type N-terminal cleavage/methylation domain-containing protein